MNLPTASQTQPAQGAQGAPRPWWRERMLWLVVGGPAVVVVASFATLFVALRHPDPVLPAQPAVAADDADAAKAQSLAPALVGRNNAAANTSR